MSPTSLDDIFAQTYSDLYSSAEDVVTRKTCQDTPLVSIDTIVEVCLSFAQLISGNKFYSYQKEVCSDLIRVILSHGGHMPTVIQARQSGKTEALSCLMATILILFPFLARIFPKDWRFNLTDAGGRYRGYRNGVRIGFYAPSADLVNIPETRLRAIFANPLVDQFLKDLNLTWKPSASEISVTNGSSVKFRTAEKRAKKEGFTFDILVLDECQDIDSGVIKKSLHPMAAARLGTIVKVGTAVPVVCDFYESIQLNRRAQMQPGALRLHHEYPHQVCSPENSLFAEYLVREKERLGEDSDEFRMSYCCQFCLERGMFITEADLMTANCAKTEGPYSDIWLFDSREIDSPYSLIAGIDFAKVHDSTVVTILAVDWENPAFESSIAAQNGSMSRYRAYKKHILAWKEWFGDNFEHQFLEIKAYLTDFLKYSIGADPSFASIWVDGTGLGSVAADRLDAILPWPVKPFIFSPKSKQEAYKLLHSDLVANRLTFPFSTEARKTRECKSFVTQMLDLRKAWKNQMMTVAHSGAKDSHDDYPDSLMLANWGANEVAAPISVDQYSIFNPFKRSRKPVNLNIGIGASHDIH